MHFRKKTLRRKITLSEKIIRTIYWLTAGNRHKCQRKHNHSDNRNKVLWLSTPFPTKKTTRIKTTKTTRIVKRVQEQFNWKPLSFFLNQSKAFELWLENGKSNKSIAITNCITSNVQSRTSITSIEIIKSKYGSRIICSTVYYVL